MEIWNHNYAPLGSVWLSALAALIPIIFFFFALAVLRLKGYIAGTITLVIAIFVAILFFKMPIVKALSAAVYGFAYGLWPISWIIIATMFLYKLSMKSGKFDVIRQSILTITDDQRLQVLLISFGFGAFLEGAAGFGAPVAISAAILVGLGFRPLYAAGLCLIANTAPVAYGALGVPIIVAGEVTGLGAFDIGAMTGRQLPVLALLIPFWLIMIMDGWRGVKETWPAAIVAGVSFGLAQFLTANYIGPELPNITASLSCLIALTLFFKVWHPKNRLTAEKASQQLTTSQIDPLKSADLQVTKYSFKEIFVAWSPFLLLTVMVTFWTFKGFTNVAQLFTFKIQVPFLYDSVFRVAPVVESRQAMKAVFELNLLGASGTAIFISALISMKILGVNFHTAKRAFCETLQDLRYSIISIGMVLGFAFVMNFSGMSGTLALVLAGTGVLFPFFSPFLGWLGVFLTGSDTSSNALFGSLQATTANQLGLDPVLMNAANTSGGGAGKMISPQSISIACAATQIVGKESDFFRFTLKHSLFFVFLFGILTMLQSYVFTWMLIG